MKTPKASDEYTNKENICIDLKPYLGSVYLPLYYFWQMHRKYRIGLIGNGNVGKYFRLNFIQKDFEVKSFTRKGSLDSLKLENFHDHYDQLDIVILCIPDKDIREVSTQLIKGSYLLAHVSGTTSIETIDSKHKSRGIFYPLMSLTNNTSVPIKSIPFCLEADSEGAYHILEDLSHSMGIKPHKLDSKERKKLHLAAVLAQNFSNHLFQMAFEVLEEANLSFDLLKPLLLQSIERIGENPPISFQTGPAIRKDETTIQQHLNMIENQTHKEIYEQITRSIQVKNEEEL